MRKMRHNYSPEENDQSPHPCSFFYACCEEQQDLSLVGAMHRLLSLALDKVRAADATVEDAVLAIVDTVMGFAVDMLQTGKKIGAQYKGNYGMLEQLRNLRYWLICAG